MSKKPEKPTMSDLSETLQALIDVAERVARADQRGQKLPKGLVAAARAALEKADL